MSMWGYIGLAGANVIGDIMSYANSERNMKFEREKLRYDQILQQQIFAREDNAVQRRAADLKAAGLSPVLAAGSAANSGAIVQTKAPNFEMPNLKSPEVLMQLAQLKREIDMSEEQKKLIKQQVKNAESTDLNIKVDTLKKQKELETNTYELNLAEQSGVSTKGSGWSQDVKNLSNMLLKRNPMDIISDYMAERKKQQVFQAEADKNKKLLEMRKEKERLMKIESVNKSSGKKQNWKQRG